jgi:CRISPR-associated protein Cmr1
MPIESIPLRAISPLFLNGANSKGTPEMRAASVRGQLRYWLRALEGANTTERKTLWDLESRILGSTEHGSQVSVRVYSTRSFSTKDSEMLPHRSSPRERSPQEAIQPGAEFLLELVTRPGLKVNSRLLYTTFVWLLLGGIGKRSRRMFGSFSVDWAGNMLTEKTPVGLATLINKRIALQVKNPATISGIPDFPTLHPKHSRIIVGTQGYDTQHEVVVDLFQRLLRTEKYRGTDNGRSFGYAERGRRASPLIAQVRDLNGKFYPVLTMMRSKPDKDINWSKLAEFMEDARKLWDGIDAWGDWR